MPKYTEAIRKVFDAPNQAGIDLRQMCKKAEAAGYKALNFNGEIWIRSGPNTTIWSLSPFSIDDFVA